MRDQNGEFLQSVEWLRLQEATGKEIIPFSEEGFSAHGIVHRLPLVGKYLYTPRWPGSEISNFQFPISKLTEEAKERNARWVRIEPETEEIRKEIEKTVLCRMVRAPHDMQPREVFKMSLAPSEEELLSQMKSKTRYNTRLAEKRGVKVFETREEKYIVAFLDLITATSGRKGITPHPRRYYEQFFQVLPEDMCRLFVAEYEGRVLAANMVIFYGDTVTYLHGGSSDADRDVMAPYLLQWEQIRVARAEGFQWYDFGGVKTQDAGSSWSGITKFKMGFSSQTTPTMYPGTYDLILAPLPYTVYRVLQKVKAIFS